MLLTVAKRAGKLFKESRAVSFESAKAGQRQYSVVESNSPAWISRGGAYG